MAFVPKTFIPESSPRPQGGSAFIPKTFQPEKKSVGGFIENVGKSAVGAVSGIGQMIANPIDTAKGIYNLGSGVVSKFIPGRQKSEDYADAVGQFYKQRYGGVENIKNTLYNDPVGALLDVSTIATGAGGALRGAGNLTRASGLARAGSRLVKAGEAIDPLLQAGRGVGRVTRGAVNRIKPAALAGSENIATRGLGNPAKQAQLAEKYGQSPADFIQKYNLYDRSPETAKAVRQSIGEQFDLGARGSTAQIPVGSIVKSIDDKIAELKAGVGGVISENTANQIDELTKRKQMFLESVSGKGQDTFTPRSVEPVAQGGEIDKAGVDFAKRFKIDTSNVGKANNQIDQWVRYLNDKPDEALKQAGYSYKGGGNADYVSQGLLDLKTKLNQGVAQGGLGDTYYHGTADKFDKFDISKSKEGNLGPGIYLTDQKLAAEEYGRQAAIRKQVAAGDLYGDRPPSSVMDVVVDKSAKIKKLDYQPTYSEAQKIRAEGFDGISYPDQTLQNTMGQYGVKPKSNAVVIFNQDKVNLSPSKGGLGDIGKYKSADDFIKAIDNQGDSSLRSPGVGMKTTTGEPVILKGFHGTTKQFDNFEIPKDGIRYTGDGVYFYPNKSSAEGFTGGKGRVVESYLDLKKPYNLYLPEGNIDYQPGSEIINGIKAGGYDSIIVRIKDVDSVTKKVEADIINEIVVFDASAIKTKDQLKELFRSTSPSKGGLGEVAKATKPQTVETLFSNRQVSPEFATEFRRKVIDPDVPKSEFGLNPKETGKAGGVKSARDIFRREIIKAVPELEQLGMDYGMAKGMEDVITKAASRASNRQLFNFTKLGSAGVGAFLNGIPGFIGGLVGEQIVNHPKFLEAVSRTLRAIAESRGMNVSPTFSKGTSAGYLFGKAGRITTSPQTPAISPNQGLPDQSSQTYNPIIQPPASYQPYQIKRTFGR